MCEQTQKDLKTEWIVPCLCCDVKKKMLIMIYTCMCVYKYEVCSVNIQSCNILRKVPCLAQWNLSVFQSTPVTALHTYLVVYSLLKTVCKVVFQNHHQQSCQSLLDLLCPLKSPPFQCLFYLLPFETARTQTSPSQDSRIGVAYDDLPGNPMSGAQNLQVHYHLNCCLLYTSRCV